MPFTISGEWIPEPASDPQKQQVKVVREKRRGTYVTLVLNLLKEESELKTICSSLKQRLACGGSVKDNKIELQGDHVESVKSFLKEIGVKVR